jgi:hypothetical protein
MEEIVDWEDTKVTSWRETCEGEMIPPPML